MMFHHTKAPSATGKKNKSSLNAALRRAFTITELVIVIAVIAILAAVLIPTFTNLINRANESADIQMVKNLNTILSSEEALGNRADTIEEALEQALDGGYKVENLTPTSDGNDIVWDAVNNRFALVDSDGNKIYGDALTPDPISGQDYWKITNDYSKTSDNTFSWYLTEDAELPTDSASGSLEVTSSINLSAFPDLKSITVSDKAEGTINITTNSEDVEVYLGTSTTANSATVNLYGTAGTVGAYNQTNDKINFADFGNDSLHIFGSVDTILAKSGKIVINKGAKVEKLLISMIYQDSVYDTGSHSWTDPSLSTPTNLTIEKKDGSTLNALYGVSTSLAVAYRCTLPTDFSSLIQNPDNADGSKTLINNFVLSTSIQDFDGGIGSQGNPFLISTAAQLNLIGSIGGDTLYFKLLNDIALTSKVQINNGNKVLDIGNYTITIDIQNKNDYCAFLLTGSSYLTINSDENGSIIFTAKTTVDCIFVVGNTKSGMTPGYLTINNGTYEARCIARADYGTVTIYGGNFNYTDTYNETVFLFNYLDTGEYEKQITIYGGVFENFNPANPGTEQESVNMVADNYTVTTTEVSGTTYYTVSPIA